jgi:putative oxidoreductase
MNNILIDTSTLAIGILLARLTFGVLMLAHGSQKLFGWFGGHGLKATGGFFDSIGFRPGIFFAALASGTEVLSGLLVALGFLGPVGPALMISVMIVAGGSMHWGHGLFAMTNGIEIPLLYGAGAAALLLTGPGAFSLDAALGLGALSAPMVAWAALAIGVIGGFGNLLARRPVTA